MKISELLGKPLISLADSSVEGILKDIIFDEKLKKAKYLVLFDDKIESEEKVLPASELQTFNNDALVIKNNDCVSPRDSLGIPNNNPASKTVFTTEGRVYGRITDIAFDGKLNVTGLELDGNRSLKPPDIAAFSDEMLIIYESGKKIKITRTAPKPKESDRVRIVSTQPTSYTAKPEEQQYIPHEPHIIHEPPRAIYTYPVNNEVLIHSHDDTLTITNTSDPEHVPQRIIGNYGFLLGRRVMADIVNQRGDVIVKKETIISPSTVENARKYGRLVELTLHSLSLQ